MKKITFILLALISGVSFAQSSADGTATVNAEIVSPILISNAANMDFGRIIGTVDGGTVTIDNDGDRTASNDNLLAPSTTYQAASFNVTAAEDYSYSITIDDIVLEGAGDDMQISFTSSLGFENVAGTGAAEVLNVGGALTVNANQAEGTYSGEVTVTVSYE
ncbi:DUF4402 domain-containing protein [Salegentibacter sp. HM20]